MTMKRRSRSNFRRSSARRRKIWETSLVEHSLITPGSTGSVILNLLLPTNGWAGVTLLRLIGGVQVQANVGGFVIDFSAGLSMKDNSVIPSLADLDEPWVWYDAGHVPDFLATQSPISRDLPVDIKSARKFRESDWQLRLQVKNEAGAGDLVFSAGLRALYALP